jgi:hypothetical protein
MKLLNGSIRYVYSIAIYIDDAPFLLVGGFFGYFYLKISTSFLSSALKLFSYIGTVFFLVLIIYYLIYPNYFAALESSIAESNGVKKYSVELVDRYAQISATGALLFLQYFL